MSCIHCENKNKEETDFQYPCLCDEFDHPAKLNIGTGLNKLPRQIATFPEFRRAMLKSIKGEKVEVIDKNNTVVKVIPLANWRARDKDDLGIMLLEMWAYVCDSLSFYDEVIANESYIRSCFLRPNLRKLIALLGYLPRPAVGSVVELAAMAEGRLLLKLPSGTAFRSGAFEGNPSQVFELDDDVFIHPFTNRLGILSPHKGKVTINNPDSLLVNRLGNIKKDDLLLLINKADESQNKGVVVKKLEKYSGVDNHQYNKLSFTTHSNIKEGALLENLQLMKPTLSAGLWTLFEKSKSINGNKITLNVLSHQIKPGDLIMMFHDRWFKVKKVAQVMRSLPSNQIKVNGNSFTLPGIAVPVTELTLNESAETTRRYIEGYYEGIIVYFGLQPIATIIDEPNATLSPNDDLYINTKIEKPVEKYTPSKYLLEDKNTLGVGVDGNILYDEKELKLNQVNNWIKPLTLPVYAFGNVITASRGEKVENEKMGSGDASIANQTFKLKKKPLTYHQSPTVDNDQGVKNSLSVYVNGVRWSEVRNFFGRKENDEIYIVRQNDEGETLVTFGDGIRGQRVPSGSDNIICNYRFGAEAACPPAGSVNQISKPVKRLQSVKNVLSAFGGADAEDAENLRIYAPRSALILGRVVSLKDMEALASSSPGVRAVKTEWRWDKNKQRASAHIFYIGDAGLRATLSQKIRSFADPSTPITVETALSKPIVLSLNIKIDPRYLEKNVVREIRSALLNKQNGLLAPENIGIGLPLYRSRIFETVLEVKGAEVVQSILINSKNFKDFAVVPGTGKYFDIEQGKLIINGKEN